ncbi:MAG: hypothetical protein JXP73_07525 [Deltaproteobacteria bacterium]|nr:hypothetical protein [Deltaproteobacteria bacterium]
MASDKVRQASKVLGPLLRRRGTSREVGATLRRALGALDKSLTGLSPQAQEEAIEAGVAELRACVELCGKSDRPADHGQLEGLGQALAVLAPPEAAVPAPGLVLAPAADGQTPPSQGPRREPGPAVRPRPRRSRAPALDFQAAGVLLDGLSAKLRTLHTVLSEPLFRLGDLYGANAELRKQVTALKWLGRERVPEILRVADAAKSASDRLAAGAALVHLGEARGAEMLMGILGKAAADQQPLPETSATLLRTLADGNLLDWLLKVFLQPAHPTVCGLLLPILAERNLLSSDQLWDLANHGKDDIAVEAAQALPWTEGGQDTQLLLSWAQAARTQRRANALLFAATVLGSTAALAEVRARVGKAENVDRLLVDALAVAGEPADAALLTDLALRTERDADYILLAAANLGSAEMLQSWPALADLVSDSTLQEMLRMLTGRTGRDNGDSARRDPKVRVLRGKPWSVAGLLACLGETNETLHAQRLMAVELRARTGQVPLSTLPVLLPAAARPELLANWNAYYAKANGRLQPGGWYYQGKSMGTRYAQA